MDKMIYLYELDSVIKTKTDMKNALEKVYNTLMVDGDKIVVSLNQIADSRFFDFWIADDTMKEVLIELLRSHRIVLLRQEGHLTAREYLLKKFKNREFISSFFDPIKKHDKISEIKEEVVKAINICNTQELLENIKSLSNAEKKHIKNYVKFIIELCGDDVKYVDDTNTYKLTEIIDIARTALKSEYPDVCYMLEFLRSDKETGNWENRSKWIKTIQNWIRNNIAFNENLIGEFLTNEKIKEINEKLRVMEIELIRAINVCYAIRIEAGIEGINESIDTVSDKNEYYMRKFKDYHITFEIPKDKEQEMRCTELFTKGIATVEVDLGNKTNWLLTVKTHKIRYERSGNNV